MVLFVVILIGDPGIAQHSDSLTLPPPQVLFGFSVGTSRSLDNSNAIGFTLGVTGDYRMAPYLFLHAQPLLAFVSYRESGQAIESTELQLPLHLMVKVFDSKTKPILSAGPNYTIDLAANSPAWFADVALGLERELAFFTISPALKYSYSNNRQFILASIAFKG